MVRIISHSDHIHLCLITTLFTFNSPIISASPPPTASPASAPFTPMSPSTPPMAAPPSPPPSALPSPPPSALPSSPFQPLPLDSYKILDALIGAGDFSKWVGILTTMTDPLSTLSLTVTLFIPETNSVSLDNFPDINPFVFPYHIVPQRLTFSDLLLLKSTTRLPTLLPGKTIVITNSSSFNFTVDQVPITRPDIYTTGNVAVHGVGTLLDYNKYGEDVSLLSNPTTTPSSSVPTGQAIITWKSDAACLCTEFPMLFLVVCEIMVHKIIQRNVLAC